MADTNIKFKIGSSFEGEGFKNCTEAIKANRQEIKSSVQGLGSLKDAFKEISPEASKATEWVGKFGSAFVTGGIVGGAITLALQGLAEAIKLVKEKMDEAKEATAKYVSILKDNLLATIDESKTKYEELRDEMSKVNKESEDLLKVLNGNAAHEAANKIFEVNTQKLNDLATAMSDEEKAIVEATANYKIALIKAEEKQTETNNAVDAYREKLSNAGKVKQEAAERVAETENALAELNEECTEYLSKRKQAEDYLATEEERFKEGTIDLKEILVARKNGNLKLNELEEEYKEDVARLKSATDDLKQAKEDSYSAERDFQNANNALTTAIKKQEEAANDIVIAEKEGLQKIEEAKKKEAEAREKLAKKEQEAADSWEEFLNGQISKLENATDSLSGAMEKTGTGLEDWLKEVEQGDKGSGKGVRKVKVTNPDEVGVEVENNIDIKGVNENIKKPKGLDDDTFKRIKDGTASVADFKRFDRYMEREERDAESTRHRMGADAVKFIQNADKPDSWLSKRDQEFQQTFKDKVLPQLPKDVAKQLLGDAQKHVLSSESMKEILGNKQIIDAWLGRLGLK